jgi:hypothetical protein
VARFRPLSDPQWSAPIVWRLAAFCGIASIVAYLVAVSVALALTGAGPRDPTVQVIAAGVAVAAAIATATAAVRTRIAPLFEVISWSVAVARQRWAGLGFPDGLPDPEMALAALADRTDETSLAARASLLAVLRREGELAALLDGWQPDTPTAAATIARQRVALDSLRGVRPDVTAACAAATAIPDAAGGARALAVIHLDAAAREGNAGRSPERELRAARRVLDAAPLDVPVPDGGPNLLVMGVTLAVVAAALPVAVAALLVLGLIGLAAVVAAVALFWVWLRFYVARRRPRVAAGVASR